MIQRTTLVIFLALAHPAFVLANDAQPKPLYRALKLTSWVENGAFADAHAGNASAEFEDVIEMKLDGASDPIYVKRNLIAKGIDGIKQENHLLKKGDHVFIAGVGVLSASELFYQVYQGKTYGFILTPEGRVYSTSYSCYWPVSKRGSLYVGQDALYSGAGIRGKIVGIFEDPSRPGDAAISLQVSNGKTIILTPRDLKILTAPLPSGDVSGQESETDATAGFGG